MTEKFVFSMVLYLTLLVYEFFVSISPVGPSKPSWKFMNIETTANSLSRSYFNLFVIFFDDDHRIYDENRSKFMMLVKQCKREMLEVPPSKKHIFKRLWILAGAFTFLYIASYIMESSSTFFICIFWV